MAKKREVISKEKKRMFFKLWVQYGSTHKASKELGINHSTARNWTSDMSEEEKQYVEDCKKEYSEKFSEEADDIIRKGLSLIKRQFERAIEAEDELDNLMEAVYCDTDMDYSEKKAIIAKISRLKCENFKDISTVIGTLYDKKALSEGKTTANMSFDVNIKVVGG